ncbi:MAG: glycosyltransferase family 1 protein [Acidobacteriota bacterium]
MSGGDRLRIGIDNVSPGESTARGGPGGMRQYIEALLHYLPEVAPDATFTLFTPDWNADFVPATDRMTVVPLPGVPRSRNRRVFYQQFTLPGVIAKSGVDVFLATATVAPLRMRVPTALVLQFLQFYSHPETYGRLRTAYLKQLVPASVRRAARVIVFTEAQRRELLTHIPCDPARISVVPHGVDQPTFATPASAEAIAEVRARALGRPFLLYVSATYGYKNHQGLIDAFAILKRTSGLPHVLLLAGSEAGIPIATLREQTARLGVAADVIFGGRLDSVAAAYQAADAFVFPSLSETFGFPVLEAMVAGCPVIATNRGATAELCADAAALVDPTDPAAMAAAIAAVLGDADYRADLIRRGRARASLFTWRRTAALTFAALEAASRDTVKPS